MTIIIAQTIVINVILLANNGNYLQLNIIINIFLIFKIYIVIPMTNVAHAM